jgi:broad specificity phosphatase PhoE
MTGSENMASYDELATEDSDHVYEVWKQRLDVAQKDVVSFVITQVGSDRAGEFGGYLEGSFNICLVVELDAKPTYVIRFPKPGSTAVCFLEEKIRNEIQVMNLLRETTIPIPKVYTWGMTSDSPSQLGPFMIMEYVEGKKLFGELLQLTTKNERQMDLCDDLGNPRVLHAYKQIADYLLQIYQLNFNAAGAISKSSSNMWLVSERPLTDNMNVLVTSVSNYPVENFPTTTCSSPELYFQQLAEMNLTHLNIQRNLVTNRENAKRFFIARHRMKERLGQWISTTTDTSPFKLYCYDFRPSNMIVDEDFNIKAVIDFEFSNALPAQFAHDPPWWLIVFRPTEWIERGYSYERLKKRLEPHIEQFLQVMEEKEKETVKPVVPLSIRMRDSWTSGRFWFNLAIRNSWSFDAVYWAALHKPGDEVLDETMQNEMEEFVDMKMAQLKAYDAECKERGI